MNGTFSIQKQWLNDRLLPWNEESEQRMVCCTDVAQFWLTNYTERGALCELRSVLICDHQIKIHVYELLDCCTTFATH